ncbi:hypothetical protein IJT17_04590, partial [bacterium]|nr:hypothetical protein [bacterium]
GFMVTESSGNVVGLLKTKSGVKSAFRVKFSYESDSAEVLNKVTCSKFLCASGDNTVVAVPKLSINMPYVSINNLRGASSALAYRAGANGKGLASSVENLERSEDGAATREFANHVPPQRAYVVVEGLAGKGLRDCETPEVANEAANRGEVMARRYVESYYTFNAPVFKGNAAMANESINIRLAQKLFVKSTGKKETEGEGADLSTVPVAGQLRSNNANIAIEGGYLNTFNGKLVCPAGKTPSFRADTSQYIFKNEKGQDQKYVFDKNTLETATDDVAKIAWEHVAKAANNSENSLKSGFYMWNLAPGCSEGNPFYELRYYPSGQSTAAVEGPPQPADPSHYRVVVTDPNIVARDPDRTMLMGPQGKIVFDTDDEGRVKSPTLTLKGQLYCDGDLLICSKLDEVKRHTPTIMVGYYAPLNSNGQPIASKEEVGVLTGTKNISLFSAVKGEGAVVTNGGDVNLIGQSLLDSSSGGVAVYGNNVALNSFEALMSQAPDGQELAGSYTGSSGGGAGGTLTISNAQASQFYNQLKGKTVAAIKSTAKAYFENTLGINASFISGTGYRSENDYFALYFNFDSSSNTSKYEVRIYKNSVKYKCWTTGQGFTTTPFIAIPTDAVVTGGGGSFEGRPDAERLQGYANTFGSVCYGDTVINGVIYAKQNFYANLGDRFKLIVNGAIRAAEGEIKVACAGAELTYDESYQDQLMPNYCTLTRELWNCW